MTSGKKLIIENTGDKKMKSAAQWFAHLNSHTCSEKDIEDFNNWLDEDPGHALEFSVYEDIWERVGDLDVAELTRKGQTSWTRLLAYCKNTRLLNPWTAPGAFAWTSAAAVFIASLVLISNNGHGPGNNYYSTAIGEQLTISLEDGSTAFLNTQTSLSVEYSDNAREITLEEGEVVFSVSKDPERPFQVHAQGKTLQVVGTEFNVRSNSDQLNVTVLEGIVEIDPPRNETPVAHAQPVRVKRGETWSLNPESAEKVLQKTASLELRRIHAMRSGKHDFDSNSLADVIAEVNRYTDLELIIADEELKQIQVSGIFRIGDVENIVQALEHVFPIHAEHSNNAIILSKRKKESI